jgi:predicted RecB family nuclease
MATVKSNIRTCIRGHTFHKNSNCEVCPVCEKENKTPFFIPGLGAPARRALLNKGIRDIRALSVFTEEEILTWHGIGPSSIPLIKKAKQQYGTLTGNKKK